MFLLVTDVQYTAIGHARVQSKGSSFGKPFFRSSSFHIVPKSANVTVGERIRTPIGTTRKASGNNTRDLKIGPD